MSKKLQRTLASQRNTKQTVCHLAKVIADMQEKMSTMQHLLSVLLDNNQKVVYCVRPCITHNYVIDGIISLISERGLLGRGRDIPYIAKHSRGKLLRLE